MMKIAVPALFVLFPVLAVAGGGHSSGHDMAAMHAQMHDTTSGRPGDPATVTRTVVVTMDDSMRYTPDRIAVRAGETIRFFLKNSGKLQHEMVIGSPADLKVHAEAMRAMPAMEHHTVPNMITLGAGQRGGLVWQFDQPGTVSFGCAVPGHLEAGMSGTIEVGA